MRKGTLFSTDGRQVLRAWRTEHAFERMRGLLGQPAPAFGEGLLIDPCGSIHTCGMAYPIDVVFLDAHGLVLRIASDLPSWRFARQNRATAVLELAIGGATQAALRPGMTVHWVPDVPQTMHA